MIVIKQMNYKIMYLYLMWKKGSILNQIAKLNYSRGFAVLHMMFKYL